MSRGYVFPTECNISGKRSCIILSVKCGWTGALAHVHVAWACGIAHIVSGLVLPVGVGWARYARYCVHCIGMPYLVSGGIKTLSMAVA